MYSYDHGKEQAATEYKTGSRDCSLGWVSILYIHIFPWQDTELKMRVGKNGQRRRPVGREFLVGWMLADVFQEDVDVGEKLQLGQVALQTTG